MRRIGLQLIAEKKAAILGEKSSEKQNVERKDVQGRDLLSLLIKSNMAVDIPENQRLSDDEVLARQSQSCYLHIPCITKPFNRGPYV